MTGPKVLLLDIETAPNRVYTWGLWKQNVAINQIEEPGYTLCWAAKWLGTKQVMWHSIDDDEVDYINEMWLLLDEADIVIHYNGSKFDIPILNQEFLLREYQPPSPFIEVDLYRTCKRRFRFASNKLDYIARQLGIGAKVQHKGMDLWKGCMENKEEDWKTMKKYNIQDVKLLEEMYEKLLPWIQPHPNLSLYTPKHERQCPSCGGTDVQARGTIKTLTQEYVRYHCQDCGKWSRGKSTVLTDPKKSNVLVGVK